MADRDMPTCPLSGSPHVTRIATIRSSDLARLFHRGFGIDIEYLTDAVPHTHLYHSDETDLRFFYPQIIGDARLYEALQCFPWYYASDKAEYAFARSLIGTDDTVLDIGSGCGNFAKMLQCRSYCGLELNKQAAADARENGVNVVCEAVNQHAASHESEYDVVCAFQVLEHVADISGFLQSAIACVKPGGRLICAVPAYDSFSQFVPNLSLDLPPHHQTRWSDAALQNVARYYDVDIVQIWHEPLEDVHRLFYAEAICRQGLCQLLGVVQHLPVDRRHRISVITIASNLLGRIFAMGLRAKHVAPRGLTVVAVYRKRFPQ
jgi:SAM-dependent methyltransferase